MKSRIDLEYFKDEMSVDLIRESKFYDSYMQGMGNDSYLEDFCKSLQELENVNGSNAKKSILFDIKDGTKSSIRTPELLRWFYFRTFYWKINYYVTLDEASLLSAEQTPSSGDWLGKLLVLNLALYQASERRLSGADLKYQLTLILLQFPHLVRKWLIRVINRDWKCGVGISTMVKIFPDDMPFFGVHLCGELKHLIELPPDNSYIIEPKLDGLRGTIIIQPDGTPQAFSRNGKPFYNTEMISENLTPGYVYDGEFFSGDWSGSMTAVKTHKGDPSKVNYMCFDTIPIEEWNSQNFKMRLRDRKNLMRNLVKPSDNLKLIDHQHVHTKEEAYKLAKYYLENGYEGGVLKNVNSPYKIGYHNDWLKAKFTTTGDFKIVDLLEGSGRNKGRLGAFVVDVAGVNSRVGGALSDQLRMFFWDPNMRHKFIGKTIEVRYQEITKDGALRFSEFVRLREDK